MSHPSRPNEPPMRRHVSDLSWRPTVLSGEAQVGRLDI